MNQALEPEMERFFPGAPRLLRGEKSPAQSRNGCTAITITTRADSYEPGRRRGAAAADFPYRPVTLSQLSALPSPLIFSSYRTNPANINRVFRADESIAER